jgi:hypothetical protein
MPQLWYSYDEVTDFHPKVEQVLNQALISGGYDKVAEVVHHPSIPGSTITPDFGIRLKSSKRYVFIIEVKRTSRDVDSTRFQYQSRSYVSDFAPYWEPGFQKYFCITNVEKLILFAERSGPISSCILKNNPWQHPSFDPATKDASAALAGLEATFDDILPLIFDRTAPEWENTWQHIIESFYSNYSSLKSTLSYPEPTSRELTLFELFRLLAYSYLKEYYDHLRSSNASHFRAYPSASLPLERFKSTLAANYDRIIRLDFKQIFNNHPDSARRIFPENLTDPCLIYFKDLITSFGLYSRDAVSEVHAPSYVFNLLTSKVYEREELHKKGKVMSDSELSGILATLCIDSHSDKVLDPGCGDGSLLDAAYDRINLNSLSSGVVKSHNEILNQVDGIEIDSFLSQLAAFRLLSKSLDQVDSSTEANITIGDIFSTPRPSQYDVVVMNPPFLRNDNPDAPITASEKIKMNAAIASQGLTSFVSEARQPNLYYYFTNYAWHYLKDDGKAGFILMTKFLNNKDGEYLKGFLLDKVEAIVSYPRKYFKDFVVSTVIVLLKKGNNSSNVSFLRLVDEDILSNPEIIKSIIETPGSIRGDYKLRVVPRTDLQASDNWRLYLLDEGYERFQSLGFLKNIEHHFDSIFRGSAETGGGAKMIYPTYDRQSLEYYGEDASKRRINIPDSLDHYISYGIKNNRTRRNYVLTSNDLTQEVAIHFPARADEYASNALSAGLPDEAELTVLYNNATANLGLDKWKIIINNTVRSTIVPKILIPRADRTKHVVYYNPHNYNVVLSTNFFYCNDLKNYSTHSSKEDQYKFISAFLLSAFGQIQFELNANNQEGLRKLEGFHIKRLLIPDLTSLTRNEIVSVVTEFDTLNTLNQEFSGDEGISTPRRNLDLAISRIVFTRDNLGFGSPESLSDYFELFLADLVEDRHL